MTPAINQLKKGRIQYQIHEYEHNPNAASYGTEAADLLGLDPNRVYKTLLVEINGDSQKLAVAVVPVSAQLDLKALAVVMQVKKVAMADSADAERMTGYVVGGISPLGQKKRLPLVLDRSYQCFDTIFVSAGRRGLEIELSGHDVRVLTKGKCADIARFK